MKIYPNRTIEGTPEELHQYFMLVQGHRTIAILFKKLSEVTFPASDKESN